jgi:nickel/cobalt transporter (NicO) family protein
MQRNRCKKTHFVCEVPTSPLYLRFCHDDMDEILIGSLVLSILHALLPNHWLPVLAIGKQQRWSLIQATEVVFWAGVAHAGSTIAIGLFLAWVSKTAGESQQLHLHLDIVGPVVLIILGSWFIYRHHHHHHFHLDEHSADGKRTRRGIIAALMFSMFLSPCMEVLAFFPLAAFKGWHNVLILSISYGAITVAGMCLWVRIVYRGLLRYDWHGLEHRAGLITGGTLILSGLWGVFHHA